jgi:hypothetical protein
MLLLITALLIAPPVQAAPPPQLATPTPTPTPFVQAADIPTEGLRPYTYGEIASPLSGVAIQFSDVWSMARSALTLWTLATREDVLIVVLIFGIGTIGLLLLFRNFNKPPEF